MEALILKGGNKLVYAIPIAGQLLLGIAVSMSIATAPLAAKGVRHANDVAIAFQPIGFHHTVGLAGVMIAYSVTAADQVEVGLGASFYNMVFGADYRRILYPASHWSPLLFAGISGTSSVDGFLNAGAGLQYQSTFGFSWELGGARTFPVYRADAYRPEGDPPLYESYNTGYLLKFGWRL